MTPDEIDIQIHELENRIDRLRALYEQYFMGFERTEPAVPRKDVERRIHDLRKVRFNNTAKRFKFQTLIQRYNTMQQYWGRICREIEHGTYKRHKLKAERTIGKLDDTFFDAAQKAPELEGADEEARDKGSSAREAARNLSLEAAELLDADADLDAELQKALGEVEAPKPAAGGGLLARLGKRSGEEASTPQAAPLPNAPRPKAAPLPPLGTLAPRPTAAAKPSAPGNAAKPDAPDKAPEPAPPGPTGTASKEPARVPSWRPVALTEDSLKSKVPTPRPPKDGEKGTPVVVRPTVPVTHASSRPPPPVEPPANAPPIPRAPPPPRPQTSLAPGGARPPGPPPPRAAPRAPVRPDSKRPPRRELPSSLSDERIRTIHEGYQRARAETNASPVTLEKLAKSLRDTEAQLIAKSNGRKVDFEVVVEAGRAMLKPKLE